MFITNMRLGRFFSFLRKYKNEKDVTQMEQPKLTLSQKASDFITNLIGSWWFIILVIIFIIFWVLINVYAWINSWDPYPFIILNLCLSCLATLQAPVILMSQNRQAENDRIRAEYDYQVNIKAEKEIQDMQRDLEQIKTMIKDL